MASRWASLARLSARRHASAPPPGARWSFTPRSAPVNAANGHEQRHTDITCVRMRPLSDAQIQGLSGLRAGRAAELARPRAKAWAAR